MACFTSSTKLTLKPKPPPTPTPARRSWCTCPSSRSMGRLVKANLSSYRKFVQFALDETKLITPFLAPSPLQEKFSTLMATDGKTELQMLSFQAPKIRLMRSLCIEATDGMQVLDFAVFPEAAFDVPIFCANFFTSANTNIVVLDLNPLHDVINHNSYKEKYYTSLIPLGLKYAELLPWGGKLTGESLKFFSPIVIWTKFSSSDKNYEALYSAFVDYFRAWLGLMDHAAEEMDASQISFNREAQHRYLTWRAEKLLAALQSSPSNLQETLIMSAIGSVASATEQTFLPSAERVLELMKACMVLTKDEDLCSRARATELVGIVAMAVTVNFIINIYKEFFQNL